MFGYYKEILELNFYFEFMVIEETFYIVIEFMCEKITFK